MGTAKNIFVSYSHVDKKYLSRLQVHLRPLQRKGIIDLWDDTRIKAGANWKEEISQALDRAAIAILLISADFLSSDYVVTNELPPLLTAAEGKGTLILPVIVKPSLFFVEESLNKFQTINNPSAPLSSMRKKDREEIYLKVAYRVLEELKSPTEKDAHANTPVGHTLYTVKLSDQAIANSVTLSDDEHLHFTINANEIWEVEGELQAVCSHNNPRIKIAFELPPGGNANLRVLGIQNAAGNSIMGNELITESNVSKIIHIANGSSTLISIKGIVNSAEMAGEFKLRWAQNTANASNPTTLKAGSYMKLTRVA